MDVRKVLGAQQVVTETYSDTIEVPAAILGEAANGESILTRIRFHEHGVTYDVIGWNVETNSLICQRVA